MSKEQYIALPEEYTRRELNARYREIPLKDTTSRLLRKYFNAIDTDFLFTKCHQRGALWDNVVKVKRREAVELVPDLDMNIP